MKLAYLVQNVSMDLREGQGTQLHIRGVILGIQHALDVSSLRVLGLQGPVAYVPDTPEKIGLGMEWGVSVVELGPTGTKWFRLVESLSRRLQTWLRLPYFALWDSLRLFDAGCRVVKGCDLLHAHFDYIPLGATLVCRNLGIPLVIDCEADWFDERRQRKVRFNPWQARWARWCQRFCLANAQAIICVSNELRDHFVATWQLTPETLHVLPNGVDAELFGSASTQDIASWREELGLVSEPSIVFVGGFDERHALDQLLESFAKVIVSVPAARLIMVGDGHTRESLITKAMELGLGSSVLWVGRVQHSSIPALIALADVTVSPSLEFEEQGNPTPLKTSPLKMFEYMAAGKPCIATGTGQAKEIISDNENGLLVPPGDVDGFAHAIIHLLSDPDERKRLGANARRDVIERHSWENYGRQLVEIYRNVLSSSGDQAHG